MSKKTKAGPTLVTFLLDRSQSMEQVRDQTIEAFNAYITGLKADKNANIDFTFLQFDTPGHYGPADIKKVFVAEPIQGVPTISRETYQPRGNTPLIDAAYKTIVATQVAIDKRGDNPKIVICIQTDGQENASFQHNWEQLSALVRAKTELGWQFNFLGCGIDAYNQGARMGVSAVNTMSYRRGDQEATLNAFRGMASNTANFASGVSATTSYSMGQRAEAKDDFIPAGLGGIDLGALNSATIAKQQQAAVDRMAQVIQAQQSVVDTRSLDLSKVEADLVL